MSKTAHNTALSLTHETGGLLYNPFCLARGLAPKRYGQVD